MVLISLPDQIPYTGVVDEKYPFFFRPKMQEQPALNAVLSTIELPFALNNSKPLAIEYCSGNGHWIVEQAKKNPQLMWVAVEKRLIRARKIISKAVFENLENIFVVCAEAHWFTNYFLKNDSIEHVFVNFPDPWPKDCHSHHRLFTTSFVEDLKRILKVQGRFHLVTDDKNYIDNAVEVFLKSGCFQARVEESSGYKPVELNEWGYSYFAHLWHSKGKKLYRTEFERV